MSLFCIKFFFLLSILHCNIAGFFFGTFSHTACTLTMCHTSSTKGTYPRNGKGCTLTSRIGLQSIAFGFIHESLCEADGGGRMPDENKWSRVALFYVVARACPSVKAGTIPWHAPCLTLSLANETHANNTSPSRQILDNSVGIPNGRGPAFTSKLFTSKLWVVTSFCLMPPQCHFRAQFVPQK